MYMAGFGLELVTPGLNSDYWPATAHVSFFIGQSQNKQSNIRSSIRKADVSVTMFFKFSPALD